MSCKNVQRRNFTIPGNETVIVRRHIVRYMFKLWKMVVYYKSTYTEWDTEHFFFKSVSTLKTSFGAKPNVLQFCPLSDCYLVNVMRIIMYVVISFVLNYKEIRNNYRSGRVASWHSSVLRYTYSINKRNVIMKATPWLKLYYPLAKRWVYSIRNRCPSVRSFVRLFVLSILSTKTVKPK